jgi:hypothetical protein
MAQSGLVLVESEHQEDSQRERPQPEPAQQCDRAPTGHGAGRYCSS